MAEEATEGEKVSDCDIDPVEEQECILAVHVELLEKFENFDCPPSVPEVLIQRRPFVTSNFVSKNEEVNKSVRQIPGDVQIEWFQ